MFGFAISFIFSRNLSRISIFQGMITYSKKEVEVMFPVIEIPIFRECIFAMSLSESENFPIFRMWFW